MARGERIVWADGLCTGDGPSLRDGALVIGDGGRLLAVGSAADLLPRHAGLPVERVRGVVLPGLVNAHTHCELSALRGHVRGGAGFLAWVEGLIFARIETLPEEEGAAIERAIEEMKAAGTVAVGDVSNSLVSVGPLTKAGFSGWVFHEAFGASEGAIESRLAAMREEKERHFPEGYATSLSYAPAPHTLYTTHSSGIVRLLAMARDRGALSSLHLAEHPGERRALEQGDGPVVEWLERRARIPKAAQSWPRRSPVEQAAALGAMGPDVLLVHLADARREELDAVARAGAPVVLCPRSNLYIETKLPPLLDMLRAGLRPALGSDSLASNTSLDVLAEAVSLRERFPSVPAAELVAMATWNGALALRLPHLGRLREGAAPGLIAIEGDLGEGDPALFALTHGKAPRRWLAPAGGKNGTA